MSIPIYAQGDKTPQQYANMMGLPIICDSEGIPLRKPITIVDSTYGGINGWCTFYILTKEDSIHIGDIRFKCFHERSEMGHDSKLFKNQAFVECVQKAIQNKLFHGYIVYPNHGEWSKPLTRHLFAVRIVFNTPENLDN